MSSSLDMSLDDIIQKNKQSEGSNGNFRGGRGRGRGGGGGRGFGAGPGPGPARRFQNRPPIRTTPYSVPQVVQVPEAVYQPGAAMGGQSSTEGSTKLYISNLDYGVSNDDIKLLFSDVGDLKRYSLHYDKSGRSKGTAEVVFHRHTDALAAIKRYNNVQLDGKAMNIELVGVNLVTPAIVPPTRNGILGNPPDHFRSGEERVGQGWVRGGGVGIGRGYGNGGSGRGFGSSSGRGHGRSGGQGGRGRGEKVSAEDLDADLDKYHLEAMKIN